MIIPSMYRADNYHCLLRSIPVFGLVFLLTQFCVDAQFGLPSPVITAVGPASALINGSRSSSIAPSKHATLQTNETSRTPSDSVSPASTVSGIIFASPSVAASLPHSASRSPHGALNVSENAYVAPTRAAGAFIAPSNSFKGYAQFTIDINDLNVQPCRGIEWFLGSGAAVMLRSILSKLMSTPMSSVAIGFVDDGDASPVTDGYPALSWANQPITPPPFVRSSVDVCNGGNSLSASPSCRPRASPSPYSLDFKSVSLSIGIRVFGNGSLESVFAAAEAVKAIDQDQLLVRFVTSTQISAIQLTTDAATGGVVKVIPYGLLLSPSPAPGVAEDGGLQLSAGAIAGIVIGVLIAAGILLAFGILLGMRLQRTQKVNKNDQKMVEANYKDRTVKTRHTAIEDRGEADAVGKHAQARLKRHLQMSTSGETGTSTPRTIASEAPTPSSEGGHWHRATISSMSSPGPGATAARLRTTPRSSANSSYTFT